MARNVNIKKRIAGGGDCQVMRREGRELRTGMGWERGKVLGDRRRDDEAIWMRI